MTDRVIFLAHRNPNAKTTSTEALACGNCQNKAWSAIYESGGDGFPRLRCTCCGWDGGRFGWVHETTGEGQQCLPPGRPGA